MEKLALIQDIMNIHNLLSNRITGVNLVGRRRKMRKITSIVCDMCIKDTVGSRLFLVNTITSRTGAALQTTMGVSEHTELTSDLLCLWSPCTAYSSFSLMTSNRPFCSSCSLGSVKATCL